ncbi:MAG: hypothetical protein KGR16_04445 [Verrucomicrobia bacterium]|nr:hypothetical protein [Verrucomicrobiota bacterium]
MSALTVRQRLLESTSYRDPIIVEEHNRVANIAMNALSGLKEGVISLWNALVEWIKNTWTTSTFVFFRIMNWVSPDFTAKIENGYLYVAHFFTNYFAQRRETTLQTENQHLRTEIDELQTHLRAVVSERNEIRINLDRLRNAYELLVLDRNGLQQNNTRLSETAEDLNTQLTHATHDLQFMTADRDALTTQNAAIRAQIAALNTQIDAICQERDALRGQTGTSPQAPFPTALFHYLPPHCHEALYQLLHNPNNQG